jgi:hypothetical protein
MEKSLKTNRNKVNMMKVVLYPFDITSYNDRIFSIDPNSSLNRDNCRYPFYCLQEKLKSLGVEIHTPDKYDDLRQCDKLLMFNYDETMAHSMNFLEKKDRILFIFEPPVVRSDMWGKRALSDFGEYFGKVYTWADNIIDNMNFFKFNYPQAPPKEGWPLNDGFNNTGKYLLALIGSNYRSEYPGELYTFRREIAKHCDMALQGFHVYGTEWDFCKSNQGGCKDKFSILRDHKFSLVLENSSVRGYISEKIFDSFFSGCIPVYYGAPNITDYIPENTFIDLRNFDSIDLLENYLANMDEDSINKYRQNILNFLKSDKFYPFSIDCFIKTVASALGVFIDL